MDILGVQAENHGTLSEDELEEILTSSNYNTQGTLSNTGEQSILEKILTSKDEKYEIIVSEIYNGDLEISPPPIINYGSKNATTINSGEDLSINGEQFRVISNNGSTIIAMPFYNITLSTTNPVQITDGTETSHYLSFSSSNYWNATNVDIDMTNSANKIQQYITAYSTKLSDLTNGKVTATIGRYSEMNAITNSNGKTAEQIRNPGQTGAFWLGTSYREQDKYLHVVSIYGGFDWNTYNFNGYSHSYFKGVRPIIVIDIT